MNFELEQLRKDIKTISFLIIREILNDFVLYNNFPILKENETGIKHHGCRYNSGYFRSLVEESRSDFVRGICLVYNISQDEFVHKCETMKEAVESGPVKYGSPKSKPYELKGRSLKLLSKKVKKLEAECKK